MFGRKSDNRSSSVEPEGWSRVSGKPKFHSAKTSGLMVSALKIRSLFAAVAGRSNVQQSHSQEEENRGLFILYPLSKFPVSETDIKAEFESP